MLLFPGEGPQKALEALQRAQTLDVGQTLWTIRESAVLPMASCGVYV